MAKRLLREPGEIERICMWEVYKLDLNLTGEEFQAMCKTEDIRNKAIRSITILDLSNKLFEGANGDFSLGNCENDAVYFLDNLPEELIQNVNEWLDDKPLTDIKVHGVSINDIYKFYKNRRYLTFGRVLRCMTDWKESEYIDPKFCFRYFQ